jgi:hypothetical protein
VYAVRDSRIYPQFSILGGIIQAVETTVVLSASQLRNRNAFRCFMKTSRIPSCRLITNPFVVPRSAGTSELVIKAQVLAGGRGKGHFDSGFQGGVHMVDSPAQAAEYAGKMIGAHLITKQTGAAGRLCNAVSVSEGSRCREVNQC